ncbi:MAG: peptide MFS transporter [Myxococcales bacterium]|nr:peptide MFS transporter [Myxococcales bacterium]
MATSTSPAQPPPTGHPRGLSTLFFTEMWERFSFYGMRAIFVPFMGLAVAEGGLGFNKQESGAILALYMSAVYLMALPGGWIADKFLGQRKAVTVGGLIIIVGHVLLALPMLLSFYAGLACLVIGTGFLKPNVSTMVGQLYSKGDARRDGGFSIFYMGINIGAFAAPVICGWLARSEVFQKFLVDNGISAHYSWHVAFGAAAVGMAFGLLQYWKGSGDLEGVGDAPVITDPVARANNKKILAGIIGALVIIPVILMLVHKGGYELTKERISNIFGVLLLSVFVTTFVGLYLKAASETEKKGVAAMAALAIGCVAFFALFEQAAGTMNAFADERTRTVAFGRAFPAEWFQSVNSVFIILLSPIFAWFFVWVIARKIAFNDIRKFGVALVFMSMAFFVMLPAAGGTDVSPLYLVGFYFFATVAELFLSPVGLSSMTKLAPAGAGGMVMGVWFLSTANGDYIAGRVHGFVDTYSETTLFEIIIAGGLAVAALMFAFGWYFTKRVPLESLMKDPDATGSETGTKVLGSGRAITGNGIAGFATAAALWPVVLTDAGLGLAICAIPGPAAVLMALRGLAETKDPNVGGRKMSLAVFPLAAVAAGFALVNF